jgi:hypothetical protein
MKVTSQSTNTIESRMMLPGQIGVVTKDKFYIGKHLLRTYDAVVLLEDPVHTWTDHDNGGRIMLWPSFEVTILPPGTKVTLETEI